MTERGNRGPMTLLGCLAIAALVAVLGIGGYIALSDVRAGAGGPADTGPSAPGGRDITDQRVDPAPLTVAEVFPGATVTGAAGEAYQLVRSQASTDCAAAATGDLRALLSSAGCAQVVRATLTSPSGAYVVTVGIFNLRDEAGARRVAGGVSDSIGAAKGRLSGYATGGVTDVLTRAPTRVGWDTQGHFLVYAVVARADGGQIGDDAAVRPIIDDLVERYLAGTVVHARTLPASSPAT